MIMSTKLQTLALLAIGSLLGYAAATIDIPGKADASVTTDTVATSASPDQSAKEPCCASPLDRGNCWRWRSATRPPPLQAAQEGKKPNILVIFGDDIGQTNVSAYSMGLMGYRTPNIDRIAREGMIFTDYYAEQSCTAGRSSFITGQCTFRTGLSQGRRAGVAGRA